MFKLKRSFISYGASAILLVGCSASQPTLTASPLDKASLIDCSLTRDLAKDLRLSKSAENVMPRVQPSGAYISNEAIGLRFSGSWTLGGNCAQTLERAEASLLFLRGGQIFQHSFDGSLEYKDSAPSPLVHNDISSDNGKVSGIEKYKFKGAALVNKGTSTADQIGSYVGLWSDGKIGVVTSFKLRAEGKVEQVSRVFQTDLPFESITYFPSPDSQSGTLGFTYRDGEDAKIVFLGWGHRGVFDR